VLCLCGHNRRLRERIARRFAGDPRLRVMGFTDRMGDVLAAADVLVHSSAGLTVLEAIIRGCPVISYGFGYGHVRASNLALERFGLAQVARRPEELGPCLHRALRERCEPDASFAARPATAQLILSDDRRARPLPAWRVRSVALATRAVAAAVVAIWAFSASAAYSLVATVARGTAPLTAVSLATPQVGLMVDAGVRQVPALARALSAEGIRVSFAVDGVTVANVDSAFDAAAAHHDDAFPRLGDGGLFNWFLTGRELRITRELGWGRRFLYASSGPSLAQWLFAHGDGGRLVAGAVRITATSGPVRKLHPGEVVEIRVQSVTVAERQIRWLSRELRRDHLEGVPVRQLLRDSGVAV
jgi:hypothetical protein